MRYLFIQPFSCVSPVSCWHWDDDVNTIRWSLFFAKDNKQTAIASNFWMKKLCNVKPKIKIQDYETTTIIMLSNMRIKFNKKNRRWETLLLLYSSTDILPLHSQGVGVGFYDCLNGQGSVLQKKYFHDFFRKYAQNRMFAWMLLSLTSWVIFFSGFISRSFT